MTKKLFTLVALGAALSLAPAADAATFVVTGATDAGDGTCDASCTFRDAVLGANASADPSDIINFQAGTDAVSVTATGLILTNPDTLIDGQTRDVIVNWTNGAGPLLNIAPAATGSRLRRLNFVSGTNGLGLLAQIQGPNIRVEQSQFRNSKAAGIEISDAGGLDPDPDGVSLQGVTVTGSAADGVDVADASRNVAIASSLIAQNTQNGVRARMGTRNVVVSASTIFGNALKPIALEGNANAGAGALSGLRIGPRQPDGTLPLSGTGSTGGAVELFRGNPSGPAAAPFTETLGISSGSFFYVPGFALTAGEPLAATLTTAGAGTSEFALVSVPEDIGSPGIVGVRAINTSQIRVRLSEPIDPATVDASDFSVDMASRPRAIRTVAVDGGGTEVLITTQGGWLEGEAGYLRIGAPGAFADAAGNASLTAGRVRVAAGPGDFTPPRLSSVSITPKKFCPTGIKRCRGPRGSKVSFTTNEEGKFEIAAFKGKKQVGNRTFTKDKAGKYTIKFSGKLRAGRLSAGRYRLRFTMEDEVGNISPAASRTIRALGSRKR